MHTDWGGSEDKGVDHILRALTEPSAKELLVAYEGDGQDPTALRTFRMDCLHKAPLRKMAKSTCCG